MNALILRFSSSRSPSSALLPLVLGGGFPYNRLQKKRYPYSNLSTGGPSQGIGSVGFLDCCWVGSSDFNFLGIQGFSIGSPKKELNFFAEGSTATKLLGPSGAPGVLGPLIQLLDDPKI